MRSVLQKFTGWEIAKLSFFFFVIASTALVFTLTPTLFPSALLSLLLFFIFSPIIDSFERKGVPRSHAITGVFLICGLLLAAMASWLTPRISNEIDAMQKGSSRYSTGITERLKAQEVALLGHYTFFKNSNFTERAIQRLQQSTQTFWSTAPNLASHLLTMFFLVPFFSFILLKDSHEIRRALLRLVPNRHFETIYGLTARILAEMGGYVAARIIEALLVTALVCIGCLALDIPYAFLLGVFAGATNAIPYLGPLIGAVPGLLLAVIDPGVPNQLVLVTAIYAVANVVDMVVIFPLIVAKIVDLHPVIVVVSVILGSQLFGVIGMIIAVPLTSILKILIQEVYSRVYNHHDDEHHRMVS